MSSQWREKFDQERQIVYLPTKIEGKKRNQIVNQPTNQSIHPSV